MKVFGAVEVVKRLIWMNVIGFEIFLIIRLKMADNILINMKAIGLLWCLKIDVYCGKTFS